MSRTVYKESAQNHKVYRVIQQGLWLVLLLVMLFGGIYLCVREDTPHHFTKKSEPKVQTAHAPTLHKYKDTSQD